MPLAIFENIIMSNFYFFIIVLIIFLILISAELLALYLHVAGFFLAGIVALFADLIFRSQEEDVISDTLKAFR